MDPDRLTEKAQEAIRQARSLAQRHRQSQIEAEHLALALVQELDAPAELVETVSQAAVESVRGQGGESARWLVEAVGAADAVVAELARRHAGASTWAWLARRRLDR